MVLGLAVLPKICIWSLLPCERYGDTYLGLLRTFSFFLLKVLYLRKLLSPRKAEKIEHPRKGNIFIWMVMILESLGLYYYREFIAWHEIAQNKDCCLASFLSRCGHMTKVWTMGQKCYTWNIRVIHGSLREGMSSLLASPTIVDNEMILRKIVTSSRSRIVATVEDYIGPGLFTSVLLDQEREK